MFTGIIEATGKIATVQPQAVGLRVMVVSKQMPFNEIGIGESIAVNGACMTLVAHAERSFKYDISEESLQRTTGLETPGNEVNLERAMRLGERLDGHLLAGHVDGVGEVLRFEPVGDNRRLVIQVDAELGRLIAEKGSIAVNGVSLTVNRVHDHQGQCSFEINLIPHTLQQTTLRLLRVGDGVNLEADLIARYCARLLHTARQQHSPM